MKIKLFLLLLLNIPTLLNAQKMVSKNGHIWFFSHTPVEDIEAHNHQAVSIFDPSTGDIQFSLLIKSFEFKIALMQEHFNENYMESDKLPKASFTGKITNIDKIDFNKDGDYEALANGDLTIHGITKTISAKGVITVKGNSFNIKAKFIVSPSDYEIKIPAVVEKNIAKEVEVNIDVTYTQN